jgi:UDP-N-acetylmuramate--alanine ligase
VQSILPQVKRRTVTYGRSAQADFEPTGIICGLYHSEFQVRARTGQLGKFRVRVPGEHNVLNATAAIAVAMELGVKPDVIREGLELFTGVDRRFQKKGEAGGIAVIDDYGHHPTEIRATLAAARTCTEGRVHVLFQPHRYTRTEALMDDFAKAFNQADRLFVMDIYAASEKPIEGITSEVLVDRLRQFGHRAAEYCGSIQAGIDALLQDVSTGDLIITLGAGSVTQAGDIILEKLKPREPANA